MKKDPNLLDVDDYYNLTVIDRCKLDTWLKTLGGHPGRTKTLLFDKIAKKVTATEFLFETSRNRDYTKNQIVGELENIYYYEEEPPEWNF